MSNMFSKTNGSENFTSEKSGQFVVQTRNFLVQICSFCNEEMELVEGATIYGDKWYHGECWNVIKNGDEKNDF